MPQVTVDPIGSVKVTVNSQNSQRVQSIQYLATGSAFAIGNAYDLEFDNLRSPIITYNPTTEKFIVQTLKAIDGGTF